MTMREILFRGKRIDNGEWVEGYYLKHDSVKMCFSSDDPKTKHLIAFDGFCDWGLEAPIQAVEVAPDSIGQYTGMKDKSGKRIFEADIINLPDGDIDAVVYNDECAAYELRGGGCTLCLSQENERLVIGNIHDNPELLGRCDHGSQAD